MKKVIKKGILLGLLFFGFSLAYSQQEYHYSQYMFSQMDINPGSAGSSGMICGTLHNRNQWVGFEGAPVTFSGTVDAPFKLFGVNSGAGLTVVGKDVLGYINDFGMKLTYAYRADAGSGKLGIGVSGGILQKSIKANGFYGYNQETGAVESVTNLPTEGNAIRYDMDIGMFYKTDEVFLGLSATHLVSSNFMYDAQGSSIKNGDAGTPALKFNLSPHIFVTGGFKKQLENPLFEVSPSMMFYTDLATSQFIGSATLIYNKKVWGGVSYRVGSALIGMIGLELMNNLQFGYSYDFETSDIGKYYRSSHEIMLRYCFSLDVDKMPKKYKSIRYL